MLLLPTSSQSNNKEANLLDEVMNTRTDNVSAELGEFKRELLCRFYRTVYEYQRDCPD